MVEAAPKVTLHGVSRVCDGGASKGAVLLVHGSGVGYRCWDLRTPGYSVLEALATRGFHAFAFDQRGYGDSGALEDGRDVRATTCAEDLVAVADLAREVGGFERVSLVGHSWGGIVAAMFAARHPHLVDAVVIVGCPFRQVGREYQTVLDRIMEQVRVAGSRVENSHHRDLGSRVIAAEHEVLSEYAHMVETHYPTMPAGVFLDIAELELASFAPSITAPTLLVAGAHDYVVDAADALEFLNALGADHAELTFLGRSKHLTFLETHEHLRLQESIAGWLHAPDRPAAGAEGPAGCGCDGVSDTTSTSERTGSRGASSKTALCGPSTHHSRTLGGTC